MKSSKILDRPEHWQSFESLCKKLWGEIWNCPEIKKNGRSGQQQHGVDVYGIPSNEAEYYGIQCKGKDYYTNKQLTRQEIDEEIEKAKQFTPKLKKLYFATTAVKDSRIEEYIRIKNLKHRKQNLFEVHIFSWEDIVDLIYENKETYNFYVKSIGFKSNYDISVLFDNNDSKEISFSPKFKKRYTHFKQKIVPATSTTFFEAIQRQNELAERIKGYTVSQTKINHSFSGLQFKISNIGTAAVEDYKLLIYFDDAIEEVMDSNEIDPSPLLNLNTNKKTSTHIYENEKKVVVSRIKNVLVSEDVFSSDVVYIKPNKKNGISNSIIKWKFISRELKKEGTLNVTLIAEIQEAHTTVLVSDPLKVRVEESNVEDYILIKEQNN